MKTVKRLQQIKALDRYIESQLEQIKRLESQALKVTAGSMQPDMVQGGKRNGKDDIYVELMEAREEVKRFTAEAIKQKQEFRRLIASVRDIDARALLQMVYIDQLDIWQICDRMGISKTTYYVKLRQAERFLD